MGFVDQRQRDTPWGFVFLSSSAMGLSRNQLSLLTAQGYLHIPSHALSLRQWVSTFLMLWPFNTCGSSCCGDPRPNPKIILLLHHNCNLATLLNRNVMYLISRIYVTSVGVITHRLRTTALSTKTKLLGMCSEVDHTLCMHKALGPILSNKNKKKHK